MNLVHRRSTIPFFQRFLFAAALMAVLLAGKTAHAQVDRASLEGTISDPSGGAIVGATAKISAPEHVSMEFAVQAFNILNHVQLGDPGALTLTDDTTVPGTNLSVTGNFGAISSTVNSTIIMTMLPPPIPEPGCRGRSSSCCGLSSDPWRNSRVVGQWD